MSETRATPVFPPGRYGRRRDPRGPRRLPVGLLAVLVVLAALAVAVRLYGQYGRPSFTPRVVSFTTGETTGATTGAATGGSSRVTVVFEVDKRDGAPAVCRVRALTYEAEEIGAADVDVPAGTRVRVTYSLVTTKRPYTVQVPRCHAAR